MASRLVLSPPYSSPPPLCFYSDNRTVSISSEPQHIAAAAEQTNIHHLCRPNDQASVSVCVCVCVQGGIPSLPQLSAGVCTELGAVYMNTGSTEYVR